MSIKTTLGLATVTALSLALGVAEVAHAAPASPGLWSELPQTSLPPAPKTAAPARILGGERVEGVTLTSPANMGPEGMVVLSETPPKGKEAAHKRNPFGEGFADTCFTRGEPQGMNRDFTWTDGSDARMHLMRSMGVMPVRSEKLVERDGGATLSVTDMWIDAVTLGARAIGKRDVTLKQVGSGPGDIKLYMMREASEASVLVVFPKSQKFIPWQLMGEKSDGTIVHSSGCRHLRVSLAAEKGRGESVVVRAPSVLGSEPVDGAGEKERGFPERQRVRFRTLLVSASTSWLGKDPEPVVSFSVGWEGRERSVERVVGLGEE